MRDGDEDKTGGAVAVLLVGWIVIKGIVKAVEAVLEFLKVAWPYLACGLGILLVVALLARCLLARRRARDIEILEDDPPGDPGPRRATAPPARDVEILEDHPPVDPGPRVPARLPYRRPTRRRRDAAADAILPEGASCLVCRGPLSRDVVWCRRCRTPHHRECFRYAGGCSLYGCGSRRYLRNSRTRRESPTLLA